MHKNREERHGPAQKAGAFSGAPILLAAVLITVTNPPALAQQTGQPLVIDRATSSAPVRADTVQVAASPPSQAPSFWQGIDVAVTPYLWFPWVSTGVHPYDGRIQSKSETIGAGDLYSHLTWMPFMGEAEFRYGDFGLITDYIHAPLKAGIGTRRDILFGGATGSLTLDTGTAMFLYRPFARPNRHLDVGMGVRAWGLNGDIALNQGRLLPATTISTGTSWADPMLALRYRYDFGNGFSGTAYGDVGGFGLGAQVDWQLIGTIDYAFNSWLDAHVGFRSMNFSYRDKRATLDMNMNGPILSATVHLN
jgi:hypothetical protein